MEIRTSTHPEKWIKLYGGDENGDLLILLGKEKPTMEWYEVKDADGGVVRYDLTGITAAATIAASSKTPVVKKAAAKKTTTTKKTASE